MRKLLCGGLSALALCLATHAGARAEDLDQPIHVTGGLVENEPADAAGVRVFKGIPYAAPPVGSLRWREPQPPIPWSGARPAKSFSPICIQHAPPARDAQPQSEDCLYLNVWTPAHSSNDRIPVMVWIHGGGFNFGSASEPLYDGENLAKKGVVFVSLNYRVGALGFLVHPELTRESPHHSSGNYGLLDQIAALKWVKTNIAAFGGDPHRVTVFGESAGSTAISALQASPLAKGLFERAIGESTAEMDPAAGILGRRTFQEAEAAGVSFQNALGAHSLAELRSLPASTFAQNPTLFWITEQDGYVLPDQVYATFAAGRQAHVDLMVGSNGEEGVNLKVPWVKPATEAEKAAFARLYSGQDDPQLFSDVVNWQMLTWAKLAAQSGERNTYLYRFTRNPSAEGHLLASGQRPPGDYHGSEIIYVFDNLQTSDWPWSDVDRQLADLMSTYWTNFAKSGDPNGPNLPPWPRFDPAAPQTMVLAGSSGVAPLPRPEAFKFLDAYFASRRTSEHQ